MEPSGLHLGSIKTSLSSQALDQLPAPPRPPSTSPLRRTRASETEPAFSQLSGCACACVSPIPETGGIHPRSFLCNHGEQSGWVLFSRVPFFGWFNVWWCPYFNIHPNGKMKALDINYWVSFCLEYISHLSLQALRVGRV